MATGLIRQCVLVVVLAQTIAQARLTVQRSNGEVLEFESSTILLADGIEPWTDVTNVPMINFAEGSTRTTEETISRNITGYFILSPSISPPATFIRTMQNLGVAGIVFGNDLLLTPGRIAINGDGKDPRDLVIPVTEIGQSAYATLIDVYLTEDILLVNLTSQEGNPWITFWLGNGIDVMFSIVCGIPYLVIFALSMWRLNQFIKVQGCTRNIPQTSLILHAIGAILRGFYVLVDPHGFRRIITFYADNILYTLPIPFVLSASLLLCFYWYEVVSNAKLKMFSFLDKLKIPFYCLCGIMIALEIITGVIRSTGVLPMFISYVITLVVYVIVILGVSIVYLVMGIKLLRRMRVSHTIKVKRSNALRQVTMLVFFSVGGYALLLIGVGMFPFASANGTYGGFIALNLFVFLGLALVSLCQVLVFKPLKVQRSSSSAKTSRSGDLTKATALQTVGSDQIESSQI